ncbi:MAG: M23 family metallopeptidase [Clostridia bacterium]|nr:M23 family metallopeptidase [Clostridia bacterium]
MKRNKRIAAAIAVVALTAVIGVSGYYGVRNRYEVPKPGAQEEPPIAYTTKYEYYTDEPTLDMQTTPHVDSAEATAPESTVAAAQTTQAEAVTVSGALPRPDYFDVPLGLDISLDYSNTEPVFNATMGDWRTHNGVDFAGVVGDPVKACAAGFVTGVYDDPMYGTVMEIDHGGGIVAKYCGLGRGSTVSVGTEVKMDDTIGYLGAVPCESDAGAHLHFEMTENGTTIDPLTVLELA